MTEIFDIFQDYQASHTQFLLSGAVVQKRHDFPIEDVETVQLQDMETSPSLMLSFSLFTWVLRVAASVTGFEISIVVSQSNDIFSLAIELEISF